MKVKFANGVVKECTAPSEQKVFKTTGTAAVVPGWVLNFRLTGDVASTELDEILTTENVQTLEFLTEDENGAEKALFSIEGYDKVTSSILRHAEDTAATYAEIQLSRGL